MYTQIYIEQHNRFSKLSCLSQVCYFNTDMQPADIDLLKDQPMFVTWPYRL